MKEFWKTTIIGGASFLLPAALILFILSYALRLVKRIAEPISHSFHLDQLGHVVGVGAATVLAEEAERNGCAPAEQARWLLVDAMTAAAQRRELQSIDAARRGQTEGEASHGL